MLKSVPQSVRHRREWLLPLLPLCAALWLASPYFTGLLVGSGDAGWYLNQVADAVTQFRAGVFPVFVGQSEFQFNGAIYPLRAAPYHLHLAGLIDLLTGQRLTFVWLLHLTGIVSVFGGALVTYAALRWLAPGAPWSAAILATLYVACPGVLGLWHAQDLYMSVMALPWVPLVVVASVKTYDAAHPHNASLILAAALAALWWAHPPIALWSTLFASSTQLARVILARRERSTWLGAALAAATFLALAAYPLASYLLLRAPGENVVPYLMDRAALLTELHQAFPANVLPLDPARPTLTFLQLGYALAAAGLAGAIFAFRPAPLAPWTLLVAWSAFLVVLLVPLTPLTRALWFAFPETLVGLTLYWPMQRLLILLAAFALVLAHLAAARFSTSPRAFPALPYFAAAALAWSAWEASKLNAYADRARQRDFPADTWTRPENIAIQRHSYGLFSAARPPYFSHGVVDPTLESRLLDPANGALLADHSTATLVRARSSLTGNFTGRPTANPGILNLTPTLSLDHGQRYLLTFDFRRPVTSGLLRLRGPHLRRDYVLPLSGESAAFGSAAPANPSFVLWTTAPATETVQLEFIPTAPGEPAGLYRDFARFTLTPIATAYLPVEVTSLVPYRAIVRSPTAALLETPRMFIPGYTATVNGHPTPATPSAAALATLAVPPGDSTVELRFTGPLALHLAFWTSALGWLTALAFAAWKLVSRTRRGFRSSVSAA